MDIRETLKAAKTPAQQQLIVDNICESVMHSVGHYFKDPTYDGFKTKPEDISLLRLWEECVGPVSRTLGDPRAPLVVSQRLTEEVMSAAFPQITASLIAAKVIEGYNEVKLVGESLCTNLPSKRKTEIITGFTEEGGVKEVKEGMPYEETGLGEKYVTSTAKKYGRVIALTAEAVMFDQTGQLLMRANRLGKGARIYKEKIILGCVIDLSGWAWYYPNGTSTAVYAAGNTVTSNALADWTDIDGARAKLAAQTDDNGDPIFAPNAVLLVPDALWTTANYILTSIRKGEVRVASAVHIVNAGAAGAFTPVAQVFSSPYLDLSTFGNSATTWYYGDFANAFVYQEIWPIQVLTRAGDSDAKWLRDIDVEYKVRMFGAAACLDNKRVIKNTA